MPPLQAPAIPPQLQSLLEPTTPDSPMIQRGSLITMTYAYWKHDPAPLLLVCQVTPQYIVGTNLHYLTQNILVHILKNCNNPQWSYAMFKGDHYIVSSYRKYHRSGCSRLLKLDCDIIKKVIEATRSLDPADVENFRKAVHAQLISAAQETLAAPTGEERV